MSGSTLSREVGCRLASYIEDRRQNLVTSIVRSPALSSGSGGAEAFVTAFLDRLCWELEVGDRDTVDVWADGKADVDEAPEHAVIVAVACAIVSAAYVSECGHCDAVLAYLALRSSELEKRFRMQRPGAELADPATMVSRDEVVSSLLSAIEARDAATCEHSRAVGMWCGRIAKTMGYGSEYQTFAVLAGTLHDVGKIATPTEILLKPGPLTDEEWNSMRAHSRIGAKMLERIPSLRDLAPVVRAHHERLDGKGYPDRLAGNAIPIASRIIAVADSFHAMISKRPYRQAMPVARALDQLRAGAGTQWDPALTEAMVAVVQPAGVQRKLRAVQGAR